MTLQRDFCHFSIGSSGVIVTFIITLHKNQQKSSNHGVKHEDIATTNCLSISLRRAQVVLEEKSTFSAQFLFVTQVTIAV